MQQVMAANENLTGTWDVPKAYLRYRVVSHMQMADGLPVLRVWQKDDSFGFTEVLRKFYVHGQRAVIARRDIKAVNGEDKVDMTRPFDCDTPIVVRTASDSHAAWDYHIVMRYTSSIDSVDDTIRADCYMRSVMQLAREYGMNHNLNREMLVSLLVSNPIVETMIRADEAKTVLEIIQSMDGRGRRNSLYDMFTAVKIARRNKYSILSKEWYRESAITYIDYIMDCIELGYDIHNPHYACPADGIVEAHRRTNRILNRRDIEAREAKEREALQRELIKHEAYYSEHLKEYCGFVAVEPTTGVTIKTINSIRELEAESAVMHHCAARVYWSSPHILLSCRWPDGSRCSTIEYDQTANVVCQNKGKYNALPDNMALVNAFIENNFPELIKQYKEQSA